MDRVCGWVLAILTVSNQVTYAKANCQDFMMGVISIDGTVITTRTISTQQKEREM